MQPQNSATPTTAAENSETFIPSVHEDCSSFGDSFDFDPFLSPASPNHHHHHGASAHTFCSQLFSQPSTTPSDTSSAYSDAFATERRLHQASYILEYQQLYNRYTICLAHLQESLKELDALRHENDALRLANADLAHRLSLLSQATIQNCLLSDFSRLGIASKSPNPVSRISHLSTTESHPSPAIPPMPIAASNHSRLERRNVERCSLPKSISVRSSGYLKLKPNIASTENPSIHDSTSPQRVKDPVPGTQRVYIPGVKREEEEALEFEVYNQGMTKTELCNKWQETGACPYGDNCQFAHGIHELRPVIRHPRYKTAVCRMVLAGDHCPYGHRCHFRHNLTEQERLIASQSSKATR